MFFNLNKNVYLVEGKCNACLYDFNNLKLYNLNNKLAEQIRRINEQPISTKQIDKDLKNILDYFIDCGLLKKSDIHNSHYIQEIKASDVGCIFAWIEITNRCNLKCRHCYNESDIHQNSVMKYDDFKLIVNSLMKLNVSKIQIIGGEPFVEKELLKKMLDYVSGKFEYIEIFTNGTLISDEWFTFLKDNKIHVALSVYSYDKDQHDNVTGSNGSWEKTNYTIRKLSDYGIPYRVCNVLMDKLDLCECNTDLYKLNKSKDIVRITGRAGFSLLNDELIRKKLITKDTFSTALNMPLSRTLVSGHNCFMNKIYISADLNVYPCVMERRIRHGKIEKAHGIVLNDAIRTMNKDFINGCADCEYRYTCFDCRPNTLSGNIAEQPWYCTYNPESGKWQDVDLFIDTLKKSWKSEG